MITFSPTNEAPIGVYLDKRHVGNILKVTDGYRYEPKKSTAHGVTFKTIAEVKKSLCG